MNTIQPQVLQGRVILISGAAKRVGAVMARHLHRAGATLALHYRTARQEAETLAAELNAERPHSVLTLSADLCDTTALPSLVTQTVTRFGQLDVLINNASSFYPTPIGSIGLSDWHDLVGSNFQAPLFLAQAAAPELKKRHGVIINITDIHAERPLKNYPLYSASKGALLSLTRALAIELAPEIRVNAVAPGPILWPEDGQIDLQEQDDIIKHTLLKRSGQPADIAAAVLFLITAAYITGQVINVDGGRTAQL